jgi:endonuclease/exonuclease/phosphatase family metal-dependent hydrolase
VALLIAAFRSCDLNTPGPRPFPEPGPGHVPSAGANGYLLCFWNLENFFDDMEDGRTGADEEYDQWFAREPATLKLKLDHLSQALVEMNDGRGPDILCVVEVESIRAAELLRDALNARLKDEKLHYQHVLMKEVKGGRHIAPAILTRLPVKGDKTQLHGRLERILEGHVVVDGHDLAIIASHWTSRLTDKDGHQRAKYASQIYGVFKAMYLANEKVDFLVCGDCNDGPTDASITDTLHATDDVAAVRKGGSEPQLLDLMMGKDPENGWGTHYDRGRWITFDQIFLSPGLLDGTGWSCDPSTVHVVNTLVQPSDKHHRPWRFGNPKDRYERGYSDHFPVTVRLTVQAAE